MATISATAARYPTDVAPFGAMPMNPQPEDWGALARLTPRDEPVAMFVPSDFVIPSGWTLLRNIALSQLTDDEVNVCEERGTDIVELNANDVEEMLELTALTQPGPFLPRTVLFGGYVGIRHGRQLVAMAGRRLSLPGWVEVSAVCTHPDARARGYAKRLLRELVRDIQAGGDRAFLHVAHGNPAQRVYEALGFMVRRDDLKVIEVAPAPDALH